MSTSKTLLAAMGLALFLAGCNTAQIDDSTFALPWDATAQYRIAISVSQHCCLVENIQPTVAINGVSNPMTLSATTGWQGAQIWEFPHVQSVAAGAQVQYALSYDVGVGPFLLYPTTTKHYPSSTSEYQVPILGDYRTQWKLGVPMADLDRDGIADRYDNCPFHHNPGQEDTQPTGGDGVGDACDILNVGRGISLAIGASTSSAIRGLSIWYGKRILTTTINGQSHTIRAFQEISATAGVAGIQGISALSSYSAPDLRLIQEDCGLAYQDNDGGYTASGQAHTFVQIYAGVLTNSRAYRCGFRLVRGHVEGSLGAIAVDPRADVRYVEDEVLARARQGIFIVVTDLEGSPANNPNYGRGRVFGRATLEREGTGNALFSELTADHPTQYVYFVLKNLQLGGLHAVGSCPTGTEPSCSSNSAWYTADGYLLPK